MYRSQAPQWDRLLLAFVRHNELFAESNSATYGAPEVTLASPIKDQPTLQMRPGADLALVSLRAEAGRVRVSLTTAGNIDRQVTYGLLGHSPQSSGPAAWEVKVTGSRGVLTWVEEGKLRTQSLRAKVQGETLSVDLPGELAEGHLMMVEALTMLGRRYLDHTATEEVELEEETP